MQKPKNARVYKYLGVSYIRVKGKRYYKYKWWTGEIDWCNPLEHPLNNGWITSLHGKDYYEHKGGRL